MAKIKRYIECNLAPEICNLNCGYCYLKQEKRKLQRPAKYMYSEKFIRKALSRERLGGVCFISLSVAGETMYSDYIINIAHELLEEGHFVNITTNGTLNKQFDKIESFGPELNKRLLFTFSLHYTELKERKLLKNYWRNVQKVKELGCSICVKLNLSDNYVSYFDEISKECLKYTGALPHLELIRKEIRPDKHVLYSKYSMGNYKKLGKDFDSELFRFTCNNLNVKRKRYFCYAGDWSAVLNLATGELSGCYCDYRKQNIYKNIKQKIHFEAIGNNCKNYCHNGQHFLAWGVIPELDVPSYGELRDRDSGWQNEEFKDFSSSFLKQSNREYSDLKRRWCNWKYVWRERQKKEY